MKPRILVPVAISIVLASLQAPAVSRAEVIEEIVAWVNGEIITKSDLEREEQMMISEAYKRFTGEELDRYVDEVRRGLLQRMIDDRILLHRAAMMFDMDKMKEAMYEDFKRQQNVQNEEEFERQMAREGFTEASIKERLVLMYAPNQVVNSEIGGKIPVGDRQVEQYYNENIDQFTLPAEVTFAEIVLLADNDTAKAARRAEADELRAKAVAGEDIGELARAHSEAGTKSSGGKIGPVKEGDLSELLENIAFSLGVGETSEVIDAPYGLHIVQVLERKEEEVKPLDEIREQLRQYLEDQNYLAEREKFMVDAREEATWCVRANYWDRLPTESPPCDDL